MTLGIHLNKSIWTRVLCLSSEIERISEGSLTYTERSIIYRLIIISIVLQLYKITAWLRHPEEEVIEEKLVKRIYIIKEKIRREDTVLGLEYSIQFEVCVTAGISC